MIVHKVTLVIAFIIIFLATQVIIREGIALESYNDESRIMDKGLLWIMTLEQGDWINYANDTLSISNGTNEPISGNGSLRADIKPAATLNEAVNSSWSVISTDFIPANDVIEYNFTMDVSAKDANQLHSKVIYYDANKNETHWDFIFAGRDGIFNEKFTNSLLPPIGTKYIKLQMLIRQSLGINASLSPR